MKKLFICLLSLLLAAGCLCSCAADGSLPGENKGNTGKNSKPSAAEPVDIYHRAVNTLTTYDFDRLAKDYGPRHMDTFYLSSVFTSLSLFHRHFPVECVRKLSEDRIAVVYKLQKQEEPPALAYLLFEKDTKNSEAEGDWSGWSKKGELYFVTEKRSSADYEEIKIGDSAERLSAIDNAVKYDFEFNGGAGWKNESGQYVNSTLRVLSDGIMRILLEAPGEKESVEFSDYKITVKEFYPFGEGKFTETLEPDSTMSKIITVDDFSFVDYIK